MVKRGVLLAFISLLFASPAFAQAVPLNGIVVSACGTTTGAPYIAGQNRPITVDLNGKLCLGGGGGSGTVTSISNADGTLTLSPNPIIGAGTVSLALSHANTWLGVQSFTDGDLVLLGASSGSSTLKAPATGGGVATLQAGAGTIAYLANQTFSNATVTGSFTATGLVTNADLVSPSTTVNGQTCTLGSTCTITATASAITVGTTTVGGGTTTRILYDNAGVLGEYTLSGTGTVALMQASPTVTGTLTLPDSTTVTSSGHSSLTVIGAASIGTTISHGTEINNGNGGASLANVLWSGTVFTGGTGTTNFPAMFVQPTGTAAVTTWSTAGTIFGVNAPSGFAGNFLDFHVAGGASLFSVASTGLTTITSGGLTVAGGNSTFGGNGFFVSSSGNVQNYNSGTYAWSGTSSASGTADTFIGRQGAASIRVGAADVDTGPIAQTLRTQGTLAGGTSNVAGATFTVIVSPGKGTGAGGSYIVQTSPAGTTGTTVNAPATAVTIDSTRLLTFNGGLKSGAASAVLTGTGTPTCDTAACTDDSGTVVSGTTATSLVITFSVAKTNKPTCSVTAQTQLVSFAYTTSTTAITITQTATTGEKIDYVCFQH